MHIHWFNLGDLGIGRAGHVILASRDQVIIHGGFAGKQDVVMSDCYTLQVTETQRDMSSGGCGVEGRIERTGFGEKRERIVIF